MVARSRQTIAELGGTMPEDLPKAEKSVGLLEKALNQDSPKLKS
jgi:hypothetical protein